MLTREEMENIQRKITPNQNEWIIQDDRIVYRNYVGKNGLLAKSASEAMCYLFEVKQKEDVTYQKALKNISIVKTEKISDKGNMYTEISFTADDLQAALVIINALTREYRKDWHKYNP